MTVKSVPVGVKQGDWTPGAARVLLYVMIGLVFATLQHRLRETYAPYAGSRYDTVSIAEGRSKSPIQRRILAPLAAVKCSELTGVPLPQVELAIRAVSLTATLWALDALLTGLGFGALAVAGPLLLACLLPLGFYVNPVIDSYPAMALLVVGLLCVQRDRDWWTLPIILFGAFIRESVLLLPAALVVWATSSGVWRKRLRLFIAQMTCYAAARLTLRWLFPGPDFDWTLPFNLSWLREAGAAEGALRLLVLALPFALAGLGLRRTPPLARAMAWTGLGYGAALLLVARLSEPRVFWDAYLLISPALVCGLLHDPSLQPDPMRP
ncbi:MAG: hypothetical protein ACO1SX_18170 [Actinomycetota bacterium]